jgi:hypothetical protein
MSACLLLWGCAPSQPQREITAAFRAFLTDVKAGDQQKIQARAPFLESLKPAEKEKALEPFRQLAGENSGDLALQVDRGAGKTYILRVSVRGRISLLVPFVQDGQGAWEMSAVISEVQHIDVVPAR